MLPQRCSMRIPWQHPCTGWNIRIVCAHSMVGSMRRWSVCHNCQETASTSTFHNAHVNIRLNSSSSDVWVPQIGPVGDL